MPTLQDSNAKRLLQFNAAVLGQAFPLVAAHWQSGAPDYSYPIGAHLRHVIEHYEALLLPKEPGVVDYDSRPRDRELQGNPYVALRRLHLLLRRLDDWTGASLDAPVQVRGRGGLAGDLGFAVSSSVGRELVFVASHAIHHYALLKPHCMQHAIPVSAEFGRAPSTVAYQSASLADRLAA
ncbi:MAG TPA: hypothetical protein VFU71_03835 [Burkholderiaceae bacterium]|nr:hypothetical protein [Burkholderiaceae bacterium]